MKRFFLFACFAVAMFVIGCESNTVNNSAVLGGNNDSQVHQTDTANFTTIQWLDTVVNFGTVPQGQKVKITFKFQNTGMKPLFISSVRPSCGCTVANYSKGAVLPGEQGEVTGEFDSNHGNPGQIHKSIMVISNTKNHPDYTLRFEGEVKEKQKKS